MTANARTSIDATDRRLVGRTYAIPFSLVWDAALQLVRGGMPRWHARWWDEEAGVIQALSRGRFSRRASDVVIRIRLDEQGQTRVDLRSTSRSRRMGDFGSNIRLIGAFTLALDGMLTTPPTPAVPPRGTAESRPGNAAGPTELPAAGADPDPVEADVRAGEAGPDPTGSTQGRPGESRRPVARQRPRSRSRRARGRRARRERRRPGYRRRLAARADASEPAEPDADPRGPRTSRARGRGCGRRRPSSSPRSGLRRGRRAPGRVPRGGPRSRSRARRRPLPGRSTR